MANVCLSGLRVVVTAASRGIGFGAAKAFLEEGARVLINSSNSKNLERALNELSALGEVYGVVGDLRVKEHLDKIVDEAVNKLGGIDTLVYVAGSPSPGTFLEKSYEDWEDATRLLTISPAYLARRVAEVMIKHGKGGRMVFLASVSIKEPIPTIALSNVCRIAIAGLVRTLARELAPKGIRVNGVLPGYIKTQRVEHLAKDLARRKGISYEEAYKELEREVPLGYIATPDELAKTIVFLGSDMSPYVTGAMIPVDGGLLRSVF